MTVREYLQLTTAKKLEFYISPGNFEAINARNEKWGRYSYPTTLEKWLEREVEHATVTGSGVVRFFTH